MSSSGRVRKGYGAFEWKEGEITFNWRFCDLFIEFKNLYMSVLLGL